MIQAVMMNATVPHSKYNLLNITLQATIIQIIRILINVIQETLFFKLTVFFFPQDSQNCGSVATVGSYFLRENGTLSSQFLTVPGFLLNVSMHEYFTTKPFDA